MTQFYYGNSSDLVEPLKMPQDLQGSTDHILRTTAVWEDIVIDTHTSLIHSTVGGHWGHLEFAPCVFINIFVKVHQYALM